MRLLAFIEYVMVFVGVVGMLAARVYNLPLGFSFGLGLAGAGIALGGMESVYARRLSFRFSSFRDDDYAGIPALIWGVVLLVIGAALIAAAYLVNEGLWRTVVTYLMRRPGALLAIMGIVISGSGALIAFSPRSRGWAWTLLVRWPKALIGALLVAAGLACFALGLWETAEPRSFSRLANEAFSRAGLQPFEHYWRWILGRLV